MFEFIKSIAAMIIAVGVIAGAGITGYQKMPAAWRVASQGWVMDKFGRNQQFLVIKAANSNVAYQEKRKCRGIVLTQSEYDELTTSYVMYEAATGNQHRYKSMTISQICEDRQQ